MRQMNALIQFNKPWLSRADQIAMLVSRGLHVTDRAMAEAFLGHVNYYRFSGYCLAFEQSRHKFLPGVTFEQVKAAYDFDWTLRDQISEAMEVVELDFRAAVAAHFGHDHGPFGRRDASNFFPAFDGKSSRRDWLKNLRHETERSQEQFVKHFKATYVEFPDLPLWMATEVMSFGCLSKMLAGMMKADRKIVAYRYNLQSDDFASWVHHLVYVRNLCAHHCRTWDRVWTIKPSLPAAKAWHAPLLPGNNKLFVTLLILSYLIKRCPTMDGFWSRWRQRVESHLASPPSAPNALEKMGLTSVWLQHPFWR